MEISKIKMIIKYVFGGMGAVTDYLLDLLNAALGKLDAADKAKVQAVLNLAERIMATLRALQWLCPTKWQAAYGDTIAAVLAVVNALDDLNLTKEELAGIQDAFAKAVEEWKSPDDEKCVDCRSSSL